MSRGKVCPNCDERFPRWRRFCRYHRWKVRLLTVERKAELDADLARALRMASGCADRGPSAPAAPESDCPLPPKSEDSNS
jgi:hypothetical protein